MLAWSLQTDMNYFAKRKFCSSKNELNYIFAIHEVNL